jgi:hypothetical protein
MNERVSVLHCAWTRRLRFANKKKYEKKKRTSSLSHSFLPCPLAWLPTHTHRHTQTQTHTTHTHHTHTHTHTHHCTAQFVHLQYWTNARNITNNFTNATILGPPKCLLTWRDWVSKVSSKAYDFTTHFTDQEFDHSAYCQYFTTFLLTYYSTDQSFFFFTSEQDAVRH